MNTTQIIQRIIISLSIGIFICTSMYGIKEKATEEQQKVEADQQQKLNDFMQQIGTLIGSIETTQRSHASTPVQWTEQYNEQTKNMNNAIELLWKINEFDNQLFPRSQANELSVTSQQNAEFLQKAWNLQKVLINAFKNIYLLPTSTLLKKKLENLGKITD